MTGQELAGCWVEQKEGSWAALTVVKKVPVKDASLDTRMVMLDTRLVDLTAEMLVQSWELMDCWWVAKKARKLVWI